MADSKVTLDTPSRAMDTSAPPVKPSGVTKDGDPAFTEADLAKAFELSRQKFHADLRKHLAEANQLERNDSSPLHPQVPEHAELRGYRKIKQLDPETMTWVERPCWQINAVVAHFHAHGLRHDSRISHEHFERALQEALLGRV